MDNKEPLTKTMSEHFSYAYVFFESVLKTKKIQCPIEREKFELDLKDRETRSKIIDKVCTLIDTEELEGKSPQEIGGKILPEFLNQNIIDVYDNAAISFAAALNSTNLIFYADAKYQSSEKDFINMVETLSQYSCLGSLSILDGRVPKKMFNTWPFYGECMQQAKERGLINYKIF